VCEGCTSWLCSMYSLHIRQRSKGTVEGGEMGREKLKKNLTWQRLTEQLVAGVKKKCQTFHVGWQATRGRGHLLCRHGSSGKVALCPVRLPTTTRIR
jgi:hypothetical protein